MLRAVLGVLLCGRAVADDRCVGGWQMGDGDGDGIGAAAGDRYVGTYTSREACIDAVKNNNGVAAKYATSSPYYCYAEYGQKWVSYTPDWENCLFANTPDDALYSGYIFRAGRCYPESETPDSRSGTSKMWGSPSTPQECYDVCVAYDRPSVRLDEPTSHDPPWSPCTCNCPGGQTSFKLVGLVSIEVRPMFDSRAGNSEDHWDVSYEMCKKHTGSSVAIADMDWSWMTENYICFTEDFDAEAIMYDCEEDDDDDDDESSLPVIVGVVCAIIVVGIFIFVMMRQRRKSTKPPSAAAPPWPQTLPPAPT